MEKKNITEIICILDRSGSMEELQQETITGLNQFIAEQKAEPGLCNFTLVQFNHKVDTTISRTPIQNVKILSRRDYQPDGYTALLDAVGSTLKRRMEVHYMLPEQDAPDKVIVFIITDGYENASTRYSKSKVSEMISQLQSNKGWEFQFFGANIDAVGEAGGIGIQSADADNWEYSAKGTFSMMRKMGDKAKEVRGRDLGLKK